MITSHRKICKKMVKVLKDLGRGEQKKGRRILHQSLLITPMLLLLLPVEAELQCVALKLVLLH